MRVKNDHLRLVKSLSIVIILNYSSYQQLSLV